MEEGFLFLVLVNKCHLELLMSWLVATVPRRVCCCILNWRKAPGSISIVLVETQHCSTQGGQRQGLGADAQEEMSWEGLGSRGRQWERALCRALRCQPSCGIGTGHPVTPSHVLGTSGDLHAKSTQAAGL